VFLKVFAAVSFFCCGSFFFLLRIFFYRTKSFIDIDVIHQSMLSVLAVLENQISQSWPHSMKREFG
jgi:hypothetical protein